MQNIVIKQQDIVMANHLDKFNRWSRHPFIILGTYQNYALGLQFTSVKKLRGKAIGYFDHMTLNNMYDNECYHSETKSFDELWNEFFKKEEKFETIDLDDDDGFEYWSRASLNDLYLFNLNDILIYDFDIKSCVIDSKFEEIMRKLKKYQWENDVINTIVNDSNRHLK
ncbi:hypothetical protein [Spiroplasma sp. DGKH1]|uniref:hypothetical protein n=1 Tax=Spiroplasma sp. DGKH1 TaxID=3050074 RepID=UPI0034C68810